MTVDFPRGLERPPRWKDLYREAELYKAVVRVYTKPLFHWRKALSTSTDGRTLYDLAAPGPTITIRYRNFRGQDLTFTADAVAARQKKNHVSFKVLPSGHRVTLARARIQNWTDFGNSLPQRLAPGQERPSPRERQLLAYHKKYGTTSPLYEKIRAQYPDW